MSFCFLYNVVSENYSVQNSPRGGGGSIASSRSKYPVVLEKKFILLFLLFLKNSVPLGYST